MSRAVSVPAEPVGSGFRIYHTAAARSQVETAREMTSDSSITHGFGWIPQKTCYFDEPYFVDNGAYREYETGEFWDYRGYFAALERIAEKAPRDPDFVVLPDCYGCAEETDWRVRKMGPLVDFYGWPTYYAVQPDYEWAPDMYRKRALRFEADGFFLGGPEPFKRKMAPYIDEYAEEHDLAFHIGRPGTDLSWAREAGADSVDTGSITRNRSWGRLRRLCAPSTGKQAKLTDTIDSS